MQHHDFQLGLEVDFIVVLTPDAIFLGLPDLRHQNDGPWIAANMDRNRFKRM